MVLIESGSRSQNSTSSRATTPEAGPVFVPPRRPSAFARRLMEEAIESDDAPTAYDELWVTGQPSA